jgi:hypothetical protein
MRNNQIRCGKVTIEQSSSFLRPKIPLERLKDRLKSEVERSFMSKKKLSYDAIFEGEEGINRNSDSRKDKRLCKNNESSLLESRFSSKIEAPKTIKFKKSQTSIEKMVV